MKLELIIILIIAVVFLTGCNTQSDQNICMNNCLNYECTNTTERIDCLIFNKYMCTTFHLSTESCEKYCYYECKPNPKEVNEG